MAKWKTLAVGAVVLALLASGFFALSAAGSGQGMENTISGLGKGITGFFTAFQPSGEGIVIAGIVSAEPFDMEIGAGSLEIDITNPDREIHVGDEKIDVSELDKVTLIIRDYEGGLSFDGSSISLSGKAGSGYANGVLISPQQSSMKIQASDLRFDRLAMTDASLPGIEFRSATGTLTVENGFAKVSPSGLPLKIGSFQGSVELNTSTIILDGTTDSFEASKENLDIVSR